MRISIKFFTFLFLAISMYSCSEDDTTNQTTFEQENFLTGYLENVGFILEEGYFIANGNYELGLDFTPLVSGKITALKVKMPEVNPTFRITIWEKETKIAIKTEVVNIATAHTEQTFDMTEFELTKDKAYIISMNSNTWYQYKKIDGSEAAYPVTVGNIQINGYRASNLTTQQVYPTGMVTSYYYGDISFDFIRTE